MRGFLAAAGRGAGRLVWGLLMRRPTVIRLEGALPLAGAPAIPSAGLNNPAWVLRVR